MMMTMTKKTTTVDSKSIPLLPHASAGGGVTAPDSLSSNNNNNSTRSIKMTAFGIGFAVGSFIQFSTLGANFVVIMKWGVEGLANAENNNGTLSFSFIWSLISSAIAVIILAFLRNIVSLAFVMIQSRNDNKQQQQQQAEDENNNNNNDDDNDDDVVSSALDEILVNLECLFVVGALFGVCLAWTITDAILGLNAQIMYSILTLSLALIWCYILMWCFTKTSSSKKQEEQEHQANSNNEIKKTVVVQEILEIM